jgi:hypothetical protein
MKPPRHYRTRSRLGTPEFLDHGFRDPRSHVVTRTGRVVLRGVDATIFRGQIYRRANGRCEVETNGKRCNKYAAWKGYRHGELYHITDRKHGGSDVEAGVLWSCWEHHRERHPGPQFAPQRRRKAAALQDPSQPGQLPAADTAGL